jgi:hypothetical protein
LKSFNKENLEPFGKGEWADWDNNSYAEDEFGEDGDDDVSKINQSIPPLQTVVQTSVFEVGWSEEPPYFDEDDVQDDEGNWGRSNGNDDNFKSSNSDIWARYIQNINETDVESNEQKILEINKITTTKTARLEIIELKNNIDYLDSEIKRLHKILSIDENLIIKNNEFDLLIKKFEEKFETFEKKLETKVSNEKNEKVGNILSYSIVTNFFVFITFQAYVFSISYLAIILFEKF